MNQSIASLIPRSFGDHLCGRGQGCLQQGSYIKGWCLAYPSLRVLWLYLEDAAIYLYDFIFSHALDRRSSLRMNMFLFSIWFLRFLPFFWKHLWVFLRWCILLLIPFLIGFSYLLYWLLSQKPARDDTTDCVTGYDTWQVSWNADHAAVCCAMYGKGCVQHDEPIYVPRLEWKRPARGR